MRKLLLFLLLIPTWCAAQTGSKPDFIRTPNSNYTIVDWNFKAKTFNLPHYSSITRRPSQDSLGTMFLSTVDQHIYIKKQAGSVYSPLAFLSDIPALTFTNDFKVVSGLVGFADTLHRTALPWTINNTSGSNPALVVNSAGPLLQTWYASGVIKSEISSDGLYRSPGMADITSSNNAFINMTTKGTRINRSIADANPALVVSNNNILATGLSFNVQNYYRSLLSVDVFGTVQHATIATANTGSAKGYWMIGGLKPSANGDKLVGLDVEPIYGTSTTSTYGSLVGGSGYPNGTQIALFTGGTGFNLTAQVTVSGGVITGYTITDSGINYTNGDVVSFLIEDVNGNPVGSGGTLTITGVTNYTGVVPVSAWFKNAPIQLDPISTPGVLQTGMLWQDGTHLYSYINGATRQLDQQIGVSSIFGRNGAVVAQAGDYNTSQVTESGNLYFTQARVLATPATGFSPSAGVISATDPLITVLNKLQGNITAATTGVSTWNGRTGAVTLTTADVNAVAPTTLGTVTAGAVPYTLLTGTIPTWNQNTTGSAATLTTPRTINGTSFNGSANITITANTTNSLANGYGILGGSFNGSSAITLRADTARGKLVTTYGLLDTIAAHGASAGYGINNTLFAGGTVAVDSTNVASKAWAQAAFYTKAQSNSNFASLTTANTFNATALGTTTTPWLTVGTNTAATSGATVQYSGLISNIGYAWNPTASASQPIQMGWEVEPVSSNPVIANYVLRASTNNASYITTFYVTNTGQVTIPQLAVFNQGFFGGTSTDVQLITNPQTASSGTPIAKSGRVRYASTVWNPNTSAANYVGFTTETGGISTTAPGGDFDIYGYFGTSSTPTFTKLSSLDAATGNLTLQTGTLIEKGTSSAINSTGTATAAQIAGGIITSTSASATTITLPTATQMATQLNITGFGRFTFAVYNTSGANTVTIALGSGMTALTTLTGENTLTIPSGATGFGRFALEFSNATTCTISRIE